MTRQAIIERTINVINQFPEYKAEEIAAFVSKRYEEHWLPNSLSRVTADSQDFAFLYQQ